MSCFKPLKGYRKPGGAITFKRPAGRPLLAEVPCGQCLGCRLDYSQEMAIRCMHEAQMHEDNCFLTLTYEDAQIPRDGCLNKEHFKGFMKRLRDRIKPLKIRYYHCGEYGEKYSRPHYHALIFGYAFPDKYWWSYGSRKDKLYRSKLLEQCWTFGHSTIGALTGESAAYTARYSMKKIRGDLREKRDQESDLKHYQTVDPHTGEIHDLVPEYATMSTGRKPGEGIGGSWYEKYKDDVFPDDFVVYQGRKVRTPRYYRRLLERSDPSLAESLRRKRVGAAKAHAEDQTPDRLAVREQVKEAQVNLLKRSYESGT